MSGHFSGQLGTERLLNVRPVFAAAVDEAEDREALDALLRLGEASSSRRVRRAPKRLADEEEGPQWGTPENPIYGQRRRGTRRLKKGRTKEVVAETGSAAVCT